MLLQMAKFHSLFLKKIYLFTAVLGLQYCAQWGLVVVNRGYSSIRAQASHCSSFSCSWAQALGVCAALVAAHGLSCTMASGILVPWSGVKPTSPALAGRLLTTGPPGESCFICFYGWVVSHCIYVPCLLYAFTCQRTFRLSPCLGYCNNATTMNMEAHASFWISVFIFSRHKPRSGKVALYRLSPMNPSTVIY